MSDGPINPDREQQRADNIASRRQSGLEPMPKDREEEGGAAVSRRSASPNGNGTEESGSDQEGDERDEIRRRIEAASGGEPVAGLRAESESGKDDERQD